MSTTFTWAINSLSTVQSPQENYVVRAMWSIVGASENVTASGGGITEFDIVSNQPNFVAFADLKEESVIAWVKEKLGVDGVAAIEQFVQEKIDALKNPAPVISDVPMPWIK